MCTTFWKAIDLVLFGMNLHMHVHSIFMEEWSLLKDFFVEIRRQNIGKHILVRVESQHLN